MSQNPRFFAISERRLYGTLTDGGHQWDRTSFTLPVECNRLRLTDRAIDKTIVDGVSRLHLAGRLIGYAFPVQTFMLGTSDNHRWRREQDLPFIWDAAEQMRESQTFRTCPAAQAAIATASQATTLPVRHSLVFARAVIGQAYPHYAWAEPFRQGGADEVNKARQAGVPFSALERALDELNFARNRVVHDGVVAALDWPVMSLAFIGARFWLVAFKRVLAWKGARPWTREDDCEVRALQALAQHSQQSLPVGYDQYERALAQCHRELRREEIRAAVARTLADSRGNKE